MIFNVGVVQSKLVSVFLKFNNNSIYIDSFKDHNHLQLSEQIINRQKLNNNLKRKAVDDIFTRPSKIIHSELKNADVESLTTQDVKLIKRNLHNARASILPKLPDTFLELHNIFDKMEFKTNKNENFLLVNSKETNIVGFSTLSNLKVLCDSDTIFVDGTFKSCPKLYHQLFTVHCAINQSYVPLVYILLPSKTTQCYLQAFHHLVKECKKNDLQFNPIRLYADFEKAIHNAARHVWPSIEVKGCRFHLGQSWYRKIQQLGLSNDYKRNNTDISNFLKLFFGLPFLSCDVVEDCFAFDIMALQPQGNRIVQFTDYILETYITDDAEFPPQIWAEFVSSTMRTTNNCESFHKKLNSSFNSSHPNIFNFIEILKNMQCDTYIILRSQGTKSKKMTDKESFIHDKMYELQAKNITQLDYVRGTTQ